MYSRGLYALHDLSLSIKQGEFVFLTGPSGAGKSTFLRMLLMQERPTSGELAVNGQNLANLKRREIQEYRRTLGFVFQFHHLLPEFTALENVMMPTLIARRPAGEARARAEALLEEMGLSGRGHHRPGALSGGEQQRVAVARALVQSPTALLADEPSGNLDQETGDRLHVLLRRLNRDKGLTLVVVTHNERLASASDRVLRLENGRLHNL